MTFAATAAPMVLPGPLQERLEAAVRALSEADGRSRVDFSQPAGEAALLPVDSVSWRVFKNPVSLFIGGITAVILELAEPRVRSGVWQHTSFRTDPVERLRRTGLAAMATVYAARSVSEPMIGGVRKMHERIAGTTPAGEPYHAGDPELLRWVHATAAFGFLRAYHAYVRPLSRADRDRYYAESVRVAQLYGASGAPRSESELVDLLHAMRPRLARSRIIFDFLAIMRRAPILPLPLRPVQPVLVRAAVELTPGWARALLGLADWGAYPWEGEVVRRAGAFADRLLLLSSPAVQACRRMRLPPDHLYRAEEALPSGRVAL
jgi:uncharacterized protein (DUF2236 family)